MEGYTLAFVFDPYSAWSFACCGTMRDVVESYSDRLRFQVVPSGLYAGITAPQQTHELGLVQKREADEVHQATGVEFGSAFYHFIATTGGVVDSQIPSSAILAVEQVAPLLAVPYLCAVMGARFTDGLDIGNRDVLKQLALKLGVNEADYDRTVSAPITIGNALVDMYDDKTLFSKMPLFYLSDAGNRFVVGERYITYNDLTRKLERFLDTEEW